MPTPSSHSTTVSSMSPNCACDTTRLAPTPCFFSVVITVSVSPGT